jgi:putative transposase
MANTYTQIHIQFVFAVQGRQSLIREQFREEVEKFITSVIQARKHKLLAIYCMPDHIHFLVGKRTHQSEADLVREVKVESTEFINKKRWVHGQFNWQDGYGAFSYSKSQVETVIAYIRNQPIHHQKRTFRQEYLEFLRKFEIEYDEKYLFDWIDLSIPDS